MTELNELTYGELTGQAAKIMVEIRRRAYREGYDQGQLAERKPNPRKGEKGFELDENLGDKLTQMKRDRVVERAKKDIEEIQESMTCWMPRGIGNYTFRQRLTEAEFVVNRKKRTVVSLVRGTIGDNAGRILERGIAKCAPNDCFNVHISKAIALRRALGLDVPNEYLYAPQPTEVRVGDIIKFEGHRVKVCDKGVTPVGYTKGTCHLGSVCADRGKIIDDSREGND